jgi:hypothetical protein
LRGVLTALPPGEDGSPPGPARAKDEQYVAMSWRLARDFELKGSGLHSRPLPPLLEGYQANGPLSQLRVPDLAAHPGAGEEARQWLLRYWKNPGAAKWLSKADTMDRKTRLSDALGLPLRTQHSCNLCFVCNLAGEDLRLHAHVRGRCGPSRFPLLRSLEFILRLIYISRKLLL